MKYDLVSFSDGFVVSIEGGRTFVVQSEIAFDTCIFGFDPALFAPASLVGFDHVIESLAA